MHTDHYKVRNHKEYSDKEIIEMVSNYNMLPEKESILARGSRVDSYDDLIDNLYFVEKGKRGRKNSDIKTVGCEKRGWRKKVVLKGLEIEKEPR